MMLVRWMTLCAIGMVIAACTTTPVNLKYTSATVPAAARGHHQPIVEVFSVTDYRKHDSNWLGVIRGGFGNPIKTLETPIAVKEIVQGAFSDALRARGLLAQNGTGRYALDVGIRRFDCSQLVRREAHAQFNVSLTDRHNGLRVYEREVSIDRVSGGLLAGDAGIFGSVEDLRKLANETMQAAIDQALNEPTFLATLNQR